MSKQAVRSPRRLFWLEGRKARHAHHINRELNKQMAIVLEVKHNTSESSSVQFEILTTNRGHFMLLYWDDMREKFIRNADLMLWHHSLEEAILNLSDLIIQLENGIAIIGEESEM